MTVYTLKIVFKKIPKLAQYFYWVGFFLIISAFTLYFLRLHWLDEVTLQQLFIGGAIVVAMGSVINTFTQLGKK
jgi:hypothetical protein